MRSSNKNFLLGSAFYTLIMAAYFMWTRGPLTGAITALLSGALFFVFMRIFVYFFTRSKRVNEQTGIDIPFNEGVIFSGLANHFRNGEAVGGKLYLLTDELRFKSHRFNIQNHEWHLPLGKINEVNLNNLLGVVQTGMNIITTDGVTEKFIVNSRDEWQSAILAAKSA